MADPERRDIVAKTDLDGVHYNGACPLPVALRMFRGTYLPTLEVNCVEPFNIHASLLTLIKRKWMEVYDLLKPPKDTLGDLERLSRLGEMYNRNIRVDAFSGRKLNEHSVTRRKLASDGFNPFFDGIYLNTGRHSASWKVSNTREDLQDENNVVVVWDDETECAWPLAMLNKPYSPDIRVLVF